MKILAIESSCDETGAAVIEGHSPDKAVTLLSNITATSAGIHARTGGVIPEEAARKQVQSIIPVIDLALRDAFPNSSQATNYKLLTTNIDTIAVTVGPGLIGSLLVGVETAKTLAMLSNKPIIPVNHLVGHIYANWIDTSEQWTVNSEQENRASHSSSITVHRTPSFPALALVVSGGHTDLVMMHDHSQFEWIGGTRDDAAGEAFDKTARLLGFDYPGGPLLSNAADEYIFQLRTTNHELLDLFPRPMLDEKNYDWSFSGLKTAVLREMKNLLGREENLKMADYKRIAQLDVVKKERNRIAAEIQESIVESLLVKTLRAVEEYKPKSLLLAGGVSANRRLREKFKDAVENLSSQKVEFFVPKPALCTDNAAYIAAAAFYNQKKCSWEEIEANPELTIMDVV